MSDPPLMGDEDPRTKQELVQALQQLQASLRTVTLQRDEAWRQLAQLQPLRDNSDSSAHAMDTDEPAGDPNSHPDTLSLPAATMGLPLQVASDHAAPSAAAVSPQVTTAPPPAAASHPYRPPNALETSVASDEVLDGGLRVITKASLTQACQADPTLALQVHTIFPYDPCGESPSYHDALAEFRFVWLSSAARTLLDLDPDLDAALVHIRSGGRRSSALRSMFAGIFRSIFVLKDYQPHVMTIVVYHAAAPSQLVSVSWFPCVMEMEGGARYWSCLAQLDYTSQCHQDCIARGIMLEHMALKYTPTMVTMVGAKGQMIHQNASAVSAFGIHASHMRVDHVAVAAPAGGCSSRPAADGAAVNYLAELCHGEETLLHEVLRVTAKADVFRRRLLIRSPVLLRWMDLEGCEVWHDVQIAGARDAVDKSDIFIVAQVDVTQAVLVERHVKMLQEQQQMLLSRILPQQVIDVLLRPINSVDAKRSPSPPLGVSFFSSDFVGDAAGGHRFPADELGGQNLLGVLQGTDMCHMCTRASTLYKQLSDLSRYHEEVTILFSDIQGFTTLSEQLHPRIVLLFLNELYSALDKIVDAQGPLGVYKVETIGDSYMVCGGLFSCDGNGNRELGGRDPQHAYKVLAFARAMVSTASRLRTPLGDPVQLRIGVHSGPCMSGVVGQKMPRFCLFGDTVNTASRMETTGVPGRVHVSQATHDLVPAEEWQPTGGVNAKGKGILQTYLLGPL